VKRLWSLLMLLLVSGCSEDAAKVVKETVEAVRPQEHVVVQVRLDRSEMPSEEDLRVRREIEEQIEVDRIGRVLKTGAGIGYYDLEVEVDSTIDAVPRIEALLRARDLRERSMVRVAPRE
jgi:hypothetical protein